MTAQWKSDLPEDVRERIEWAIRDLACKAPEQREGVLRGHLTDLVRPLCNRVAELEAELKREHPRWENYYLRKCSREDRKALVGTTKSFDKRLRKKTAEIDRLVDDGARCRDEIAELEADRDQCHGDWVMAVGEVESLRAELDKARAVKPISDLELNQQAAKIIGMRGNIAFSQREFEAEIRRVVKHFAGRPLPVEWGEVESIAEKFVDDLKELHPDADIGCFEVSETVEILRKVAGRGRQVSRDTLERIAQQYPEFSSNPGDYDRWYADAIQALYAEQGGEV